MTNQQFWLLINESYHNAAMDEQAYSDFLAEKLFNLADDERYQFSAYVGYYAAKAEANPKLALLMKVIQGYVTDDSLLYFALWLVSRGEEIYFATLENIDNFISLVSPDVILQYGDDYYAPNFEALMSLGRKDDEYDIWAEIPEDEYQQLNQIYQKKIPDDPRSYYDLVRAIETLLPKTMAYFNFDRSLLAESLANEEQQNTFLSELDCAEQQLFDLLQQKWQMTELVETVYPQETRKGAMQLSIAMPLYQDSIIMYTTKLNETQDGAITKACFWRNIKTGETKMIQHGEVDIVGATYLTGDDESLYFYVNKHKAKAHLAIYHFATNRFSAIAMTDALKDDEIANLITVIGRGQTKSGVIYHGKLYFSLSYYQQKMYVDDIKEKTYVFDIIEKTLVLFADNISHVRFDQNKMYFLKIVSQMKSGNAFQPKTLYCQDLNTQEQTEIAHNVLQYVVENGVIYYSCQASNKSVDLIRLENTTSAIIFHDQKSLMDFAVAGETLFMAFYVSAAPGGGHVHSFIVNFNTGTISKVATGEQISDAILDDDKYLAFEGVYDERNVFLKVHQVALP